MALSTRTTGRARRTTSVPVATPVPVVPRDPVAKAPTGPAAHDLSAVEARTATAAPRRPHLYRVDLMRLVAFLCVIVVHVTGTTYPFPGLGPSFLQLVLHATRAAFFFLSTLVLFHSAYDRPPHAGRSFRSIRRRVGLLGVPYVVWSIAYWALGDRARIGDDLPGALTDLRIGLTWGVSWYHLYFLLVSLQIGVLLPLFIRLVRASTGRHGTLLALATLVQLAATTVLFHEQPYGNGLLEWYRVHGGMLFPSYAGFIVAGALAGVHGARWHAWVEGHTRTVWLVVLGTLALTYGWFRHTVSTGRSPIAASLATQPASVLWGGAAVLGLYALAARWERARRPRPTRAMAALGAELAFGVYLVHPMILRLLELGGFAAALPWAPSVDTLVLCVLVAGGSALFTWLLSRTPLAPFVIGRARARRRTPIPAREPQQVGRTSLAEPVVSSHASGA